MHCLSFFFFLTWDQNTKEECLHSSVLLARVVLMKETWTLDVFFSPALYEGNAWTYHIWFMTFLLFILLNVPLTIWEIKLRYWRTLLNHIGTVWTVCNCSSKGVVQTVPTWVGKVRLNVKYMTSADYKISASESLEIGPSFCADVNFWLTWLGKLEHKRVFHDWACSYVELG